MPTPRRSATLNPAALAAVTIHEAKLLCGRHLSTADWSELEQLSVPVSDLARLIGSAQRTPSASSLKTVLISSRRGSPFSLEDSPLRDAVLLSAARGQMLLDAGVTVSVYRTDPESLRREPRTDLRRLTQLLRGLNALGRPLSVQENLMDWTQTLYSLIIFLPRPAPERTGALISDVLTHLQLWQAQHADDHLLSSRQGSILEALFYKLGPQHVPAVWAAVTALDLQDDSRLLEALGTEPKFTQPLSLLADRLKPLRLPFRDALKWSSDHRDGLHWTVRQSLSTAALSADQATEVAHLAEHEHWDDVTVRPVPPKNLTTPASASTFRRLCHRMEHWPSRWLAEEFESLPKSTLRALAKRQPLALAHLSLLSAALRAALADESQMWKTFHARTASAVRTAAAVRTP